MANRNDTLKNCSHCFAEIFRRKPCKLWRKFTKARKEICGFPAKIRGISMLNYRIIRVILIGHLILKNKLKMLEIYTKIFVCVVYLPFQLICPLQSYLLIYLSAYQFIPFSLIFMNSSWSACSSSIHKNFAHLLTSRVLISAHLLTLLSMVWWPNYGPCTFLA